MLLSSCVFQKPFQVFFSLVILTIVFPSQMNFSIGICMCCHFFHVLGHPLWPHLPVQLPFHFSASLYRNSHQKSSCQSFISSLEHIPIMCQWTPHSFKMDLFKVISDLHVAKLNDQFLTLILLDSWAALTEFVSIPLEMLDSRIPYSPGFPRLFFLKKQKQKPTACFQCSLLVLPHFLNLMDFPGHRPCSSVFRTIYAHSFNVLIQFHGLYNSYMLMTPTAFYIQLRSHF